MQLNPEKDRYDKVYIFPGNMTAPKNAGYDVVK